MRLDGFRVEFLDFDRGIRVGHLEPHQRITQLLKRGLEVRYHDKFVIDRYGRGVYWQWICFVPRSNRATKPRSHRHNFGCSKFFIMIDREKAVFKSGLQVERGLVSHPSRLAYQLQDDWDWHRLVKGLKGNVKLYRDLRGLVREDGFNLLAGGWKNPGVYSGRHLPSAVQLRRRLMACPDDEWGVFQLYYPLTRKDIRDSNGPDIIESILAIFQEVVPVMNHCMQTQLEKLSSGGAP